MYVSSREIIKRASENWYAVPAFLVTDIHRGENVIRAAELVDSPVILVAGTRLCASLKALCQKALIPVAMQPRRLAGSGTSRRVDACPLEITLEDFKLRPDRSLDTICELKTKSLIPLAIEIDCGEIEPALLKRAVCLGVAELYYNTEGLKTEEDFISFCVEKFEMCGSAGKGML